MVHRIIDDIDIPHYVWRKAKPIRTIKLNNALDTETVNGRCFLISDALKGCIDEREFKDLYGLLTYLHQKPFRSTINWFYNLEYDTNAVLKFLSIDKLKEIAEEDSVNYEDFNISIIPKKELRISKVVNDKFKNPVFFFDLAQFYEMKKLDTLAKENTSFKKVIVDDIAEINLKKYYKDIEYHKLIQDRCFIDCKITKELADQFTVQINKIANVHKYRSKASISRRYVLENIKNSLKIPNLAMLQAALNVYHAGHVETLKLGTFKNVYNIDINSAYPFHIADLYTCTGNYKHNKEYEPDSAFSIYEVEIDFYDPYVSILWHVYKTTNYHPNGFFKTWITQRELEYLMCDGYDLKILRGFHLMKPKDLQKPFNELINTVYAERLKAKERKDDIQLTYKIIMNAMYGAMLNTVETKETSDEQTSLWEVKNSKMIDYKKRYKATNLYNPLWAAFITANTRVQLFTDFKKHFKHVIQISTDAVHLQKKVKMKYGKELGGYSVDKYEKICYMGSGRQISFLKGVVEQKASRFRSVPMKAEKLYEMIGECNTKTLRISREKPVKLKESIRNKKFKGRLNEFISVEKRISLNDLRRFWYDDFTSFADVLDTQIDSRPYDIKEISF